jgi:hypothetical protein
MEATYKDTKNTKFLGIVFRQFVIFVSFVVRELVKVSWLSACPHEGSWLNHEDTVLRVKGGRTWVRTLARISGRRKQDE